MALGAAQWKCETLLEDAVVKKLKLGLTTNGRSGSHCRSLGTSVGMSGAPADFPCQARRRCPDVRSLASLFRQTWRSLLTRPTSTHSTTKMLPF